MICPRCGMDLKKEALHGVEVDRCGSCWGLWLDKGEFGTLLSSKSFRFTEEETDAVLKGIAHETNAPQPKQDQALVCPKCGKTMGKARHNAAAAVTLDRCDAHGMWLDTKELKQAQAAAQALQMVLAKRVP